MGIINSAAIVAFSAVFFLSLSVCTWGLDFRYHRYDAMVGFLRNFTNTHKNLTRLYSIGKSVQGRELYVVEITAVKNNSSIGVPNVKLIGNIHGNEAVGRELLLHFIEYLVENYSNDSTIQWYLNHTIVHILPSLNPDGFEISNESMCDRGSGRENANNLDLNRSFPDFFRKNKNTAQPETLAVQKWMRTIPFILSASLHGGALVANYPYENHKQDAWELAFKELNESSENSNNKKDILETHPWKISSFSASLPLTIPPSISPDDDVFQHLAILYAETHPKMHLGVACHGSPRFEGGITNGAAWYMITGGMQDYNYVFHGCMEITLEISCCKYPAAKELPGLWKDNKMALLEYIKEAHRGVKGIIIDAITKEPIFNASLKVQFRDMPFYSTRNGEFWRILLPGYYNLQVTAKGYEPKTIPFTVQIPQKKLTEARNLTVELYPVGHLQTTATSEGFTTTSVDGSSSSGNFVQEQMNNKSTGILTKDESEYFTEYKEPSAVISKGVNVDGNLGKFWILILVFICLMTSV